MYINECYYVIAPTLTIKLTSTYNGGLCLLPSVSKVIQSVRLAVGDTFFFSLTPSPSFFRCDPPHAFLTTASAAGLIRPSLNWAQTRPSN